MIASVIITLILTACSRNTPVISGNAIYVYDLSADSDRLEPSAYEPAGEETSDRVGELLGRLKDGPDGNGSRSAIPNEITDVSFKSVADSVIVDLGSAFAETDIMRRLLCEAAVVKTLCQLDGVQSVSFTVDGAPLCDHLGEPVGSLTPESFFDEDGTSVLTQEKVELHLFFASADGQKLIEKTETVGYDVNTPMDRLVVENIISGPKSSDVFATVNPSTKINSVTTLDGTCYVNLSKDFLNKKTNVSSSVMIYSIVNSLAPVENINKVRILIDGDAGVELGEYSLSGPFERNLEITE